MKHRLINTLTDPPTLATEPVGPSRGFPLIWNGDDPSEINAALPEGNKYVPQLDERPPFDAATQTVERAVTTDAYGWAVRDKTIEEIEDDIAMHAENHRASTAALARQRAEAEKLAEIEAEAEAMDDETALENPTMFPPYEVGVAYQTDQRLWHPMLEKLYRVIQPHTSSMEWRPDQSPSLYEEVQVLDPGDLCLTAPAWDAADWQSYTVGAYVHHNDAVWQVTSTSHTYVAPSETGDGAISWAFVKSCP